MTTRFATTGIAATLLLAAVFLGIDWMTGNVLAAFVAELAVGAALLWDSR